MMNKSIEFSEEAEYALDLFSHTNENIFITGKAGTGKSTLLNYLRESAEEKIIVLAPTGISAINVNGDTIHSFFRLKPGFELDEAKNVPINDTIRKKYKQITTIVIDEISMVRADIIDAIDIFLKRVRKSVDWFGGVRMIFFGDLFQLPPVVTEDEKDVFYNQYKTPYFFSSHIFIQPDLFTQPFKLLKIELSKIYRQTEFDFIKALNSVRNNQINNQDLDYLNSNVDFNFVASHNSGYIHLVTTNSKAYEINNFKLNELEGTIQEFKAVKSGKIGNLQPNDQIIKLKVGAQVMFINNDSKRRWVNGSIGIVEAFSEEFDRETQSVEQLVKVKLTTGKTVLVKPFTWEITKYVFKNGEFKREQIGYFIQIPLKTAWAITIHKSQGKTFDKVIIDLGMGSFVHGQTYVALSRCTNSKGLVLKRPIKYSDIIVDDTVLHFFKN